MEVLKIKILQKTGHYRMIDTVENRMTYPLPPLSTIIGAIHNCCGWTSYHEMDIGVIGKFDSVTEEFRKIEYLLDNVRTDRGTLVKLSDGIFQPNCVKKICSSVGGFGDFKNEEKTIYFDKQELDKYFELCLQEKNCKNKNTEINKKLKNLKQRKKDVKKDDEEYKQIENQESLLLKDQEENKKKWNEIKTLKSKYSSLQNGICHYEVLNNVELVLYISTSEKNMEEIKDNIYNLTSLGRSEDFVNVESIEIINLKATIDDEYRNKKGYSSYIDVNLVKNYDIFLKKTSKTFGLNGTVYYICKDYEIKNGKRVFHKKKVVHASDYEITEESNNVYIDDTENDGVFIVNLL